MTKANIAIFASGSGTNAEQLLRHFTKHSSIRIGLIVSNNPSAGVLQIAQRFNVPTLLLVKIADYESNHLGDILLEKEISHIVLAGFMRKIPSSLIDLYPNKMINIHPSLLPKYGGKGMFGMNVHQAIVENNEQETGITIHLVNNEYDKGEVLFQAKCTVNPTDDAPAVAKKVQDLEHRHFPLVIEKYITNGA